MISTSAVITEDSHVSIEQVVKYWFYVRLGSKEHSPINNETVNIVEVLERIECI